MKRRRARPSSKKKEHMKKQVRGKTTITEKMFMVQCSAQACKAFQSVAAFGAMRRTFGKSSKRAVGPSKPAAGHCANANVQVKHLRRVSNLPFATFSSTGPPCLTLLTRRSVLFGKKIKVLKCHPAEEIRNLDVQSSFA